MNFDNISIGILFKMAIAWLFVTLIGYVGTRIEKKSKNTAQWFMVTGLTVVAGSVGWLAWSNWGKFSQAMLCELLLAVGICGFWCTIVWPIMHMEGKSLDEGETLLAFVAALISGANTRLFLEHGSYAQTSDIMIQLVVTLIPVCLFAIRGRGSIFARKPAILLTLLWAFGWGGFLEYLCYNPPLVKALFIAAAIAAGSSTLPLGQTAYARRKRLLNGF